jgi:5'-nucleotidase
MKITNNIFIVILLMLVNLARTETIVIIYTHNTNGVLENCDCPEHSYGAIEKRAFIIDSIRKVEQNILLIDTGDILDIRKSTLVHDYIMYAYAFLNYDYWVPGDQDFVEGTRFFLDQMSGKAGTMLVTNLMHQGKNLGEAFAIEKFCGIKIGLTGTIRADLFKYLDSNVKKEFVFHDQIKSLIPVVSKLKEQSDFIVLLSHSGIDRDRDIAKSIPEINLILGAHSQTLLPEPELIGNTYITQVGESGYRVGVLKLSFKNKKLYSLENRIILLTKKGSEDPTINALISEYHQKRLQK